MQISKEKREERKQCTVIEGSLALILSEERAARWGDLQSNHAGKSLPLNRMKKVVDRTLNKKDRRELQESDI